MKKWNVAFKAVFGLYNERVEDYFRIDMFWEEKIDRLKKEIDSKDFKVPFTDWSAILKNVEDKFIVKENSNYSFLNWADRLKDKRKIKELRTGDIENALVELNPDQNYWIVLAGDNSATKT